MHNKRRKQSLKERQAALKRKITGEDLRPLHIDFIKSQTMLNSFKHYPGIDKRKTHC